MFTNQHGLGPYMPGSLLGIEDLESYTNQLLKNLPFCPPSVSSYSFRPSDVQDILPVAEFGRQFLDTLQVQYNEVAPPVDIDLDRLAQACQEVLRRHPILRSAFLPMNTGTSR